MLPESTKTHAPIDCMEEFPGYARWINLTVWKLPIIGSWRRNYLLELGLGNPSGAEIDKRELIIPFYYLSCLLVPQLTRWMEARQGPIEKRLPCWTGFRHHCTSVQNTYLTYLIYMLSLLILSRPDTLFWIGSYVVTPCFIALPFYFLSRLFFSFMGWMGQHL